MMNLVFKNILVLINYNKIYNFNKKEWKNENNLIVNRYYNKILKKKIFVYYNFIIIPVGNNCL